MAKLRETYDWLITPPPGLEATVGWFVSAMRVVLPTGCVIHALLIPVFLLLNVPILALVNVGSLLVWVLALLMSRSRALYFGTTLAMTEVLAHAWICVSVLGWASGFQYYLLGALVSFFLFPGKRVGSYATIALAVAEFAILFAMRDRLPSVVLDASTLATMSIANIVFAFALSMMTALHYVHVAERAEKALQEEHAKSEALLENVMPGAIAARLKQSDATIADSFPDASVLFADIVGFTELSQTLAPSELVRMLDGIFSAFDEMVVRHGVEKIKTIGDAYMVASGIPTPRPDHAEALAALALEMQQAMPRFDSRLRIRIGIHSGPVVAGVIGRRRFLYDLWGDTVNTASRMESHGLPGEIQITEATRALLEGKFSLEERGSIEVKGKGAMRTYLLRRR